MMTISKAPLIIFALFVSLTSYGQSNLKPIRNAFPLTVMVDDTSSYHENIAATPYLLADNSVQIYPGEEIFVEVEFEGSAIKKLTTVEINLHPSKTIVLNLSQRVNGKWNDGMQLIVANPFKKTLEYKAGMQIVKHDEPVDMAASPVLAGSSNFEMWPQPVISMKIGNWKLN